MPAFSTRAPGWCLEQLCHSRRGGAEPARPRHAVAAPHLPPRQGPPARRERRDTRLQPHPHQPQPLLDGAVPRGRAVHPHARLPSALRGGHLCSPIRPRGALLLGGAMTCVCSTPLVTAG